MQNLLPRDGCLLYDRAFMDRTEADRMVDVLLREIEWRDESIVMFGKRVMQPRRTALYGDVGLSYRYSGRTMHPTPWTPALLDIKHACEAAADTTFTTVLLNLYRNGLDSMGWHRDNERSLGTEPSIASVSLGATRLFQCKHRTDRSLRLSLPLDHGSLVVMKGAMQEHWYHCVPKELKVQEVRINLTFRRIVDVG